MEVGGEAHDNVIHANESSNPSPTITDLVTVGVDDKRRSLVWPEYLVIEGSNFTDGMKRAKCSQCKRATFIATSNYEMSNMKKHLEKCKAYQSTKASQ